MDNNYVLRGLRYALNISDSTMVKIFSLGEYKISENDMLALLRKEDDKIYTPLETIFDTYEQIEKMKKNG